MVYNRDMMANINLRSENPNGLTNQQIDDNFTNLNLYTQSVENRLYTHTTGLDPHPQYATNDEVTSIANALIEARVGDYVTSTFASNTYTVVLNPAITTAAQRNSFSFKAAAANTGAVNIADGAGTAPLLSDTGGALVADDIQSGAVCTVVWDSSTSSYRMTESVLSQLDTRYYTQTQSDAKYSPLASPIYTGTPTAPTAAAGTNTTQLATTAFVVSEMSNSRPFEAASANIKMNSIQSVGTLNTVARGDHVHPTDTSRAPIASPALTGTPTAPTTAVDTSTTQVATTAFVTNQAASTIPVADGTAAVGTSKRYARADHVHPTDSTRAPLASPALTGTPTAPTAGAKTKTTQLATTAFLQNELDRRSYTSSELSMTNGGQITVNHMLGEEPAHVSLYLKCVVAEFGYEVGDVIRIAGNTDYGGSNESLGVVVTTTQFIIRVGDNGPQLIGRKDNGAGGVATSASWRLIIKASVF